MDVADLVLAAKRGAGGRDAVSRRLGHFFLIGAVLFGLARVVRAPEAPELGGGSLEDLLVRQALALGLDRDDPVVLRRLLRNMRFVEEGEGRDAGALYRGSLALGMDRSDVVVRRRLAQRMRLLIEARAREAKPAEAELRAFFEQHRDAFAEPARVRLTQVFVARDRVGAAERLLAQLEARGTAPDAAARLADPFLHPVQLPPSSERELATRFGPGFAQAAFEAAPGVWSGPVESAYGDHLIFVRERRRPRLPPFGEVRGEVRRALLDARAARALAAFRDAAAPPSPSLAGPS